MKNHLILFSWTSVHYMHVWWPEGPKRALEPMKLRLKTVRRHHIGAGNQPRSSGRVPLLFELSLQTFFNVLLMPHINLKSGAVKFQMSDM